MIDWIEGHNNDPRFQFKVLVSHDGVYNLTSMYGATEELWFTDWEFKGTPWTNTRNVSAVVAEQFCKEFQNADLDHPRELDYRVRWRRLATIYGSATNGRPVEIAGFPRRGSLGAQTSKFTVVVSHGARLAGIGTSSRERLIYHWSFEIGHFVFCFIRLSSLVCLCDFVDPVKSC